MPNITANSAPLDPQSLVPFAADMADAARALSRHWFRHALRVDLKADASPVTIADREIEAAIRRHITEVFPDHGIFGEESGRERCDADVVWVIDPIDGTRSFISGWPLFGMLLAALWRGRPVFGQIDMPALDERWVGCSGRPTLFNSAPVTTSGCGTLAAATVYTTSPDAFSPDEWRVFETLTRRARTRRFGGDCYSYGLLASGFIDLVVECNLQPYDYLSLVPVIEGAGGIITDWQGRPLDINSDGRVVAAATPALHAEALAVMGEA
jgi:inositol-phosphate phosphatase / L-galactose 1-phosphate phosphatase / histidinol-phosphatase